MAHGFGVKWDGYCCLCQSPLDVRMKVSIDILDDVVHDIVTFFEHHSIPLAKNRLVWKVRGGKAYRCCDACYKKPWPVPNLREREVTGRSRRGGIKSGSMSRELIHTWFKSLYTYINMDPEGKYKRIPFSELSQGSGITFQISSTSRVD